jgi:hypothetical protein
MLPELLIFFSIALVVMILDVGLLWLIWGREGRRRPRRSAPKDMRDLRRREGYIP